MNLSSREDDEPVTTPDAARGDAYVLFELAGATYALRSDEIQQLEMVADPTPVPNAAPFVDGVTSVRGDVVPVVSLRARFGFPRAPHDLRSRLVIVRTRGRRIGLVVDRAREFAAIPPASIHPLPEGVAGLRGRYLRGLARHGDRLVLVLDAAELLSAETNATPTITTDRAMADWVEGAPVRTQRGD